MNSSRDKIKKIVLIGLFSALAYVCMFVFRIKVQFLTFDAKDAVMTIGAMFLGSVPGVIMSFIVAFVEFVSVSDTGIYGFIMNFASSAVFACVASAIYRHKKGINTAIFGLFASVAATTVFMMVANIIITPFYTGLKVPDIIAMIPTLLLPFNLIKSVLNASLVLLLYKPVTTALIKVKMIDKKADFKFNKNTLIMSALGVVLLVVSIIIFMFVLNGKFELVNWNK